MCIRDRLYGENIGTCVTSLISSIGASKNARRAATMHLVFNIIGTLVFMFLPVSYTHLCRRFKRSYKPNGCRC